MFIPTWILVVIGVVLFLMFGRALIGALIALALILLVPVAIASMCFAMYFWKEHEYTLAVIVGSPFLALCAWGLFSSTFGVSDENGRLNVGALNVHLVMHRMQARMLSNPASIMKARMALANRIKLGEHLLTFYREVKYMPNWYNANAPTYGGESWTNNVIPTEAIAKLTRKDLASFGIEATEFSDHNAVAYRFSGREKHYVFCAYDDAVPDWVGDFEDEPRWMFSALKVYVVELPSKIVLEDSVVYKDGDIDVYHSDYVESLRPGGWLVTLFKTADAVRAESEDKYAAFSKQREEERARKFS